MPSVGSARIEVWVINENRRIVLDVPEGDTFCDDAKAGRLDYGAAAWAFLDDAELTHRAEALPRDTLDYLLDATLAAVHDGRSVRIEWVTDDQVTCARYFDGETVVVGLTSPALVAV